MTKILMSLALLAGCAHAPLPHRAAAELFPQANSPPAECPGQHKMTVSNIDGTWFIYCFGIDN
jgi:hypothetical protein